MPRKTISVIRIGTGFSWEKWCEDHPVNCLMNYLGCFFREISPKNSSWEKRGKILSGIDWWDENYLARPDRLRSNAECIWSWLWLAWRKLEVK